VRALAVRRIASVRGAFVTVVALLHGVVTGTGVDALTLITDPCRAVEVTGNRLEHRAGVASADREITEIARALVVVVAFVGVATGDALPFCALSGSVRTGCGVQHRHCLAQARFGIALGDGAFVSVVFAASLLAAV
jgi:hypothetical protein